MNSVKLYLLFWLSGLIAGAVLMERWRRQGGRYVPVEPDTPAQIVPETVAEEPAHTSNFVGLVLSGAKLDAASARRWITRTMPMRSDAIGKAPISV